MVSFNLRLVLSDDNSTTNAEPAREKHAKAAAKKQTRFIFFF
jgi:hypothetical protein